MHPASDQSKNETKEVSNGVSNNVAAADANLPTTTEMEMLPIPTQGQPNEKSSAASTTCAAENQRVKKTQGRGRKKIRRPQSSAQEEQQRPDSALDHLPISSDFENSVVACDPDKAEKTAGATTIEAPILSGNGQSKNAARDHANIKINTKIIDTETNEAHNSNMGSLDKVTAITNPRVAVCPSRPVVEDTSDTPPSSSPKSVKVDFVKSSKDSVPPSDMPASEALYASQHSVVVDQPLDDLYTMIRQQREQLFQGPLITIHIGARSVTGIYKRAAMATSTVLNEHFTKTPESLDFIVQDYIAPQTVEYMLSTWMCDMCHDFEVIAMPLQSSFSNNVAILRAARLLGMEAYAKWILIKHVEYLRENIPSYEEIVIVEHNKTSDHDRKCLCGIHSYIC